VALLDDSAIDQTTIRLWDVASRQVITTLTGVSQASKSIAFSPDGKTLATGDRAGTIRLWTIRRSPS
jgi:WD40 repeat protein